MPPQDQEAQAADPRPWTWRSWVNLFGCTYLAAFLLGVITGLFRP